MTKAELLHFLEPFTDDCQILVRTIAGLLDEPRPEYKTAKESEIKASLNRLTDGEGFVAL